MANTRNKKNIKKDPFFKKAPKRARPDFTSSVKTYFLRHAQVLIYSLGQLFRSPTSMLMTSSVIGIALALPAGLHVLLQNTQSFTKDWDGLAKISIYMDTRTTEKQALAIKRKIEAIPEVENVRYVSKEEGLEETKRYPNFELSITALDSNPLPIVLVVTPRIDHSNEAQLDAMAEDFRQRKHVDQVKLDSEWIKRLFATMDLISRGILIFALMLGLGVLLVVGNTIRLAIQNRREEIVVIKLIGGTNSFIRRPFLYTGFWYGLIGGIIALILVTIALWQLNAPLERLISLGQTDFNLSQVDFGTILVLLGSSIGLGLAGSWIAVSRHLHEIEPR